MGRRRGPHSTSSRSPDELIDEHGRPKDGATVLPADATQRQCINASVDGNSFVMDGPPGTGKSQTIANMIAENIASGRTVLFVSEKAAALDVVETRMRQVGLGDYTLELHSHKATRKEVAQELARALTHHPQAGPRCRGASWRLSAATRGALGSGRRGERDPRATWAEPALRDRAGRAAAGPPASSSSRVD